jgi:transglutaminase-like putative cysteine protease
MKKKWKTEMQHRLLLALILVVMIPFGYGADSTSYSVTSPASWVRDFSVHQNVGLKLEEGTHYLLYDRQVRVSDDGAEYYHRIVLQLLDSDALSERSQIEIEFDPTYQRLTLHGVTVIRDGKVIDKLESSEIKVVQQEHELKQQIFGGNLTTYIVLKDVRVNDVIDYSYTIHGTNPILGKKFFKDFSLGWSLSIDDLRLRVIMPEHRSLRYRLHRWEQNPIETVEDGHRSYEWHISPTKIINIDAETPDWYKQRPSLQLSEYKDWSEVELWASSLYSQNEADNKTLRELVNGWKKEGLDKQELVLKALDFVQNDIRYFGFEFGENSHRPSPPSEVLENRYGDCKDKSLLFVKLMDQLGIEAYPALVSSRDLLAINDALPSPGKFDHAIVKLIVDGKTYWLDPTITRQVGDLEYRYVSNYGYALVIDESRKGLESVLPIGYKSKIEMFEHFNGKKINKEMELVVKTSYFGPIGAYQKDNFSERTKEKKTLRFASYYEELYDSVNVISRLGIDKSPNLPKLDLTEHYMLANPWHDDEFYYLLKTNADIVQSYLPGDVLKTRKSPLNIGSLKLVNYQAIVSLDSSEMPAQNELDEDVTIHDKVFTYHRKVTRNDDQLIIDHRYETMSDFVAAEDLTQFSENINKVRENLIYWVKINKAEAIEMKDRMERIKAILRKE